jgi:predicted RNA-binding Zn-ribbon protein involved in translation (DUF1610 family)
MPITVLCPTCGKKLKAPDSASGKRAKCPECGSVVEIPEIVFDAEEVTDEYALEEPEAVRRPFSDEDFEEIDSPAAAGPTSDVQQRRPCPACGEMIVAGAAKCRFCGEIFDPTLKQKEHRDVDKDLTTGDWVLAILCSGIGCIIGIVWLIQGKPKAGKMIGVSILASIFWSVIRVMIETAAQ